MRALVDPDAVKRVRIIADSACFRVEAGISTATIVAMVREGAPKTSSALDSAAKWIRGLRIGMPQVDVTRRQSNQTGLRLCP